MEEILLQVDNLTKKYKHFTALDDLSLTIYKGDIYGFVGKNGAGKTTLIRIITGLNKQTSGNYKLNVANKLGSISAIVESPSLHLELNGYDNLKMQAILLGIKDYDQKILDVLNTVSLENTNKKAKNYSLGMRQRLAIAMSLLSDPEFLILDEPANGLDAKGIQEIRQLVIKLNQEKGITILISSHYLDELDKMATRYGFIDKGHMIKEIDANTLHNLSNDEKYIYTLSDTLDVKQTIYNKFNIIAEIEGNNMIIDKEIDLLELSVALKEINVKVLSFEKKKTGLEEYFINLIDGGRE